MQKFPVFNAFPAYHVNVKIPQWPFLKQIAARDLTALEGPAISPRSHNLASRTRTADRVVKSICPYCAVGCGQDVYVRDGKIIDIEGRLRFADLARLPLPERLGHVSTGHRISPGPRGALPPARRNPLGDHSARRRRWTWWPSASARPARPPGKTGATKGNPLRRTLGIAHLGGATLDNEENYLIKKLFTALGIVQIENQARI